MTAGGTSKSIRSDTLKPSVLTRPLPSGLCLHASRAGGSSPASASRRALDKSLLLNHSWVVICYGGPRTVALLFQTRTPRFGVFIRGDRAGDRKGPFREESGGSRGGSLLAAPQEPPQEMPGSRRGRGQVIALSLHRSRTFHRHKTFFKKRAENSASKGLINQNQSADNNCKNFTDLWKMAFLHRICLRDNVYFNTWVLVDFSAPAVL